MTFKETFPYPSLIKYNYRHPRPDTGYMYCKITYKWRPLYMPFQQPCLNSLWPSDIWRRRSWSTLVQALDCYFIAPNNYLNQCWITINETVWHSFQGEIDYLTLNVRDRVISVKLGQYHGCWWPGSLRRQDISSHDIDYVEYVGPGLTWWRILSTCVISMWSNDIKCKYMFMFPLQNLARIELRYKNVATYIHAF